eukprot:15008057-Alexandrium_andersonii.AAC.1
MVLWQAAIVGHAHQHFWRRRVPSFTPAHRKQTSPVGGTFSDAAQDNPVGRSEEVVYPLPRHLNRRQSAEFGAHNPGISGHHF